MKKIIMGIIALAAVLAAHEMAAVDACVERGYSETYCKQEVQ